MEKTKIFLIAALVALVFFASGCIGPAEEKKEENITAPTVTVTIEDWETYESVAGKFSIDYPASWIELPIAPVLGISFKESDIDGAPEILVMYRESERPHPLDGAIDIGFLITESVPELYGRMSHDAWDNWDLETTTIISDDHGAAVFFEATNVNSGTRSKGYAALFVRQTSPGDPELGIEPAYRDYFVTFDAPKEDWDKYWPMFQKSLNSFKGLS